MEIDVERLAIKAQQLVSDKRFKDALTYYRQLRSYDDSTRWMQAMADCYLARAREFAHRAMYRQAVEQWRQYQQLVENPLEGLHEAVLWQLGSGDLKAAELMLSQLSAEQLDGHADFCRNLALLVLGKYAQLRTALAKESQFVSDLNIVESALHCLPDTTECLEQLQQLSENSAFCDIADFIRALLKQLPLKLVAPESWLSDCIAIIPVLQLQGEQFIHAMAALDSKQRQLLYRLRKLQPVQQQFIEQFVEHAGSSGQVQQFDLIMQFKQLTDSKLALAFCQATLPNDFIRWVKFKKQFPQCTGFQLCRLKALACERSGDYHAAEQHWLDAIDCLRRDPEKYLHIALILRHIAEFYPTEEQISWLEESLQYDPDDIATQDKLGKLEQQTMVHLVEEDDQADEISLLFTELSKPQQQRLWQMADQLMMECTPEQLAEEFQAAAGQVDLEQLLARTPALMDGLLLLKAARQLEFSTTVTVDKIIQTVLHHE